MNPERRKRYRGYRIEEVVNLVMEPTSDSEISDLDDEAEEDAENITPNQLVNEAHTEEFNYADNENARYVYRNYPVILL